MYRGGKARQEFQRQCNEMAQPRVETELGLVPNPAYWLPQGRYPTDDELARIDNTNRPENLTFTVSSWSNKLMPENADLPFDYVVQQTNTASLQSVSTLTQALRNHEQFGRGMVFEGERPLGSADSLHWVQNNAKYTTKEAQAPDFVLARVRDGAAPATTRPNILGTVQIHDVYEGRGGRRSALVNLFGQISSSSLKEETRAQRVANFKSALADLQSKLRKRYDQGSAKRVKVAFVYCIGNGVAKGCSDGDLTWPLFVQEIYGFARKSQEMLDVEITVDERFAGSAVADACRFSPEDQQIIEDQAALRIQSVRRGQLARRSDALQNGEVLEGVDRP